MGAPLSGVELPAVFNPVRTCELVHESGVGKCGLDLRVVVVVWHQRFLSARYLEPLLWAAEAIGSFLGSLAEPLADLDGDLATRYAS